MVDNPVLLGEYKMRVIVYFETPNFSHAEQVAEFFSEELYLACLPALEKQAKENGWVVTESVREDEFLNDDEQEEMAE